MDEIDVVREMGADRGNMAREIVRLRVENDRLLGVLKQIWPYFRYRGVSMTFSPADYAFLRDLISSALGIENFFDAVRNDPEMSQEQKDRWLSKENDDA